jgi:hypothetical protein
VGLRKSIRCIPIIFILAVFAIAGAAPAALGVLIIIGFMFGLICLFIGIAAYDDMRRDEEIIAAEQRRRDYNKQWDN